MVFSIASQKGGTGKTSTSISLAAGLARQGKKVLLIDIDSQANSSKVLLRNYADLRKEETLYATILGKQPLPVRPTSLPNLDIVPSHILLSNTDIELTTAIDHREERLNKELEIIQDRYDCILIDCPPALSWLTINAFTASNEILVTIAPGYFELDSIVQLWKTIAEVKEYYNRSLRVRGLLFTMSDSTKNSETSLKILRQTYPEHVLQTIIPRNTDLRDAHFNKQDVFSFAPQCKAAEAYDRLIKELFPDEQQTTQ